MRKIEKYKNISINDELSGTCIQTNIAKINNIYIHDKNNLSKLSINSIKKDTNVKNKPIFDKINTFGY